MEKVGLTTEVNRFQFEMLLSLMPSGVIRVPSPTAFGTVEPETALDRLAEFLVLA
jgi:hypothetical protein